MRPVLIVLFVVGVSLVSPARGTAATQATCRGVPATIVATEGHVTGTSGDDVIVISGGALSVDAGPGDDLICLVDVDAAVRADAGDDTVDTTQSSYPSWTTLGLGVNTFFGGPGEDRVDMGGAPESLSFDTVDTGAGDDVVNVQGRSAWLAVRTGSGSDTLAWGDDLPPGSFDLQGGLNRIEVRLVYAATIAVDVERHRVEIDGRNSSWRGQVAQVFANADRVDLWGDDRSNELTVNGCLVTMRGRGGDDRLRLVGNRVPFGVRACPEPRISHQFGGAGSDVLSGMSGPDLLVGGRGLDTAYGLGGHDVCDAEQERRCES